MKNMKKEDVDKAAKEEVENTVFYNICTEEIDNEESNYEAGRRDALYDFGQELFIVGIKWYLNNIWHDINELPDFGKGEILLASHKYGIFSCFTMKQFTNLTEHMDVYKWIYVTDLLSNLKI